MSFKREGNDTSLLGNLRKRRIKELFTEDIPEDEAKLLSNGRFTCTVCPSRPIFDTVSMLAVHRNGKKHIANLEIHLEKKRELKCLIAQRRHEQFLKDGTTSIKVALPNHSGILTCAPYDPHVKKAKLKPDERRPKVHLDPATHKNHSHYMDKQNPSSSCSSLEATELPGNRSHWSEMCKLQMTGPVKHDHQLKNIFGSKMKEPVTITPYQSKHKLSFSRNAVASSNLSSFQKYNSDVPSGKEYNLSHTSFAEGDNHIVPKHYTSNTGIQITSNGQRSKPSKRKHPSASTGIQKSEQSKSTSGEEFSTSVAQKLKQLQGSGWKRDWDGKWIKDENAEFDSDEDPPDIP